MDRVRKAIEKAGYTVESIETLTSRLQGLSRLVYFVNDDRIDVEDRVKEMNITLIMIAMVWGRAREDDIWGELYTSWGMMEFWWITFLDSRHTSFIEEVQLEELTPIFKMKEGKQVADEEWQLRIVKPSTAIAEITNKKDKIRIVSFKRVQLSSMDEDEAFKVEDDKRFFKWFGEAIMILTGFQILNYAWKNMDITAKETLVLQGMPQSDYSRMLDTGDLPGGAPRPSSSPLPRTSRP